MLNIKRYVANIVILNSKNPKKKYEIFNLFIPKIFFFNLNYLMIIKLDKMIKNSNIMVEGNNNNKFH